MVSWLRGGIVVLGHWVDDIVVMDAVMVRHVKLTVEVWVGQIKMIVLSIKHAMRLVLKEWLELVY